MSEHKGYVPECVICQGSPSDVADKPWNAHPSYKGVALRHLLTGSETDDRFSSHMVRVDPGCCLEPHVHDGQWELHEVVEGSAEARVGEDVVTYVPGTSSAIPQSMRHSVTAGSDGVLLLAKFIPALV
jgi:quercetin dioxygenase-like cupin family protein